MDIPSGSVVPTRQPPHILIFNITPIRPLIDFDSQCILLSLSTSHNIADIKFRGISATLAIPHFLPVNPDMISAIYSFESQTVRKATVNFPINRDGKVCLVETSRVVGWWIGRMRRKGIIDVCIVGRAIPLQLPVRASFSCAIAKLLMREAYQCPGTSIKDQALTL